MTNSDEWCHQCERMHGPMDYGDGCLTDRDIEQANRSDVLSRLFAGPWVRLTARRCTRRLRRRDAGINGHFGRCELRDHAPHIDHALERGMYWVRWGGEDARVSGTWLTPS